MAFKDVEGQERIVEFFRSSVNRERLAHAYLFLGPEGAGKTFLAKTLAKFLNCENPLKDGALFVDCCDSCISCRKIDETNHPDVHWVQPGKYGKISIDDIRLLQKEVFLKAYEGKLKVFIILQAQQMTEEAANSLLKTLEEPSKFSLIILTSVNLSGLLPTIISRCQIIKFYPRSPEGLRQEKDILIKKNRLIERLVQVREPFSAADVFNIKDKQELSAEIRYLLYWFRDIAVFKAGLEQTAIINSDRIKDIKSQAPLFPLRELEQIIAKIIEAHRLIEQNVNPKIALEVMLRRIEECRK